MRWVGLRNNNFFVNYISPQAGNGEGGTVELDGCGDRTDISNNIFTGPSAATVAAAGSALPPGYSAFSLTSALELYGRNTNIANNTVTAYGLEGIGAISFFDDSTIGAMITQNHVLKDNGWSSPTGGVKLGTSFAGVCGAIPRETSGVVVTANDSNPIYAPVTPGPATQAYGVYLEDHGRGPSTDRLLNVTADSSNYAGAYPLFGQQYQVFLDPFVGLYGYSGQMYQTASSGEINPRLLQVDVTDASSSASSFVSLWPTPPLCSDPQVIPPAQPSPPPVPPGSSRGSPRAKFKFSASDAQGASNIYQIQGLWSTGGADTDGSGGPSGTTCSFLYYASTNILYLWDSAVGQWRTSVVGAGGNDLLDTGSGCTIHAGNSTSWASTGSPQATPMAYVWISRWMWRCRQHWPVIIFIASSRTVTIQVTSMVAAPIPPLCLVQRGTTRVTGRIINEGSNATITIPSRHASSSRSGTGFIH